MNYPDAVTSETQRWSLTDAAQASWSLGQGGQAEESRKTQSEIIQAIVSSRVRKRHQRTLQWQCSARIMEIKPHNLLRGEKMILIKTVSLKDRLALQAQRRRAAGAPCGLASLSRGWTRSGQCEAARLRSLSPGPSHCGLTTDWIRMRIF